MSWIIWVGMALCLTQSAMFSGLNLGMLGPSRLRLQVAAKAGDQGAQRILELRSDFHLLLTTILWGNVAVNTLFALLADSMLAGVVAFAVSTVGITVFGEIIPQAYISRHAYLVGGVLSPLVRVYRTLLYPVAWPTARMLDLFVGKEGLGLFREEDLREMLRLHMVADSSDLSHVEGHGALNFLALDDRDLIDEAEPLHPESIVPLTFIEGRPQFPTYDAERDDPFLTTVDASRRMWIVITDEQDQPRLVLNANTFLRSVMMRGGAVDPANHCHEPLVVTDTGTKLETVLRKIELQTRRPDGQALHPTLILLWTPQDKRVLTGVDLLENLLRGVADAGIPQH